jgi:hypothetical protein
MPANLPKTQPGFADGPRFSLGVASIEYRVQWDDAEQTWDVFRNGVMTYAREMRAAAIASALQEAKAEFKASSATVFVTCLEGRRLETLWRATQLPVSKS